MMRFIVRFLAVVGLLFIVMIAGAVILVSRLHMADRSTVPIKDGSVLTLEVEGPFIEEAPARTGLASALGGRRKKLRDVITGIDRAADDSRIKGLIIKIGASAGMAQTQELRGALKRFRAAGKFAYAFADDYGESGSGNGQYYLASACDQVWLQPMGQAMLTNVAFEAPFLKDAFGKIGVEPEFTKRAEYKTAPETFTERGFTPAAREMMESLATDLTQQLATDLAASRNLSADDVRALLARGPMTADEAVQAKLVDHVGYADEVVEAARKAAGGNAPIVPLVAYVRQATQPKGGDPNIALINAVGDIDRVGGPINPDSGAGRLDPGNAVVSGFAKAMATPSVKVIVFRVDSPGGSVSGSESIRRAVVRAKQAGKKIVVSMGSEAASGGYWISTNADKIVADPATLTGSIGVFSGKFVIGKGLADLGVTVDRTEGGPYTGMDSPFQPFSPEQTQKLNSTIDVIYSGFVARVSEGRNLPPATVAQSAKGRVWTGQQAKQIGLVDSLGGLEDAIKLARDIGGIPADQPSIIRIFPEPLTPLEAIKAIVSGNAGIEDSAAASLAELDGPGGDMARALLPLFRQTAATEARMPDLGLVK